MENMDRRNKVMEKFWTERNGEGKYESFLHFSGSKRFRGSNFNLVRTLPEWLFWLLTQFNSFIFGFKVMLIKGITKATKCCLIFLSTGFEFTWDETK